MTGYRGRSAIVLGLALSPMMTSCGQAPNQDASASDVMANRPETALRRTANQVDEGEASPTAVPLAGPAGVPLPRATPAPSAIFHAAYQRVEDHWEQVLFLCDGIGGDRVKLVTVPNAKGLSQLWTYRKPDFRTDRVIVRLGDDDPGAGQIMREIRRPDGSAFGSIHSINPGMLGDAEATTLPTLSSITDKSETTQCRWMPRGRVLLTDAKRSIMVTAEDDGSYTYRSFDYAKPGKVIEAGEGGRTSTATVTVKGGRLVPAEPGREVYEFSAGPWTYRVSASADNRAPGAGLMVSRAGKPVTTSVAAAYQMAAQRIE